MPLFKLDAFVYQDGLSNQDLRMPDFHGQTALLRYRCAIVQQDWNPSSSDFDLTAVCVLFNLKSGVFGLACRGMHPSQCSAVLRYNFDS